MPYAETYRPKHVFLDLGTLAAIAALLAAIHFLISPTIQHQLAFDHGSFSLLALLTSAYVHANDAHLYGNLLGFALTSLYAYVLCLHAGKRRWFHLTTIALLLVLPFLVNAADYAIFAYKFPEASFVSRGFSSVVAGFGGFLLVALCVYLAENYTRDLGTAVGVALFLLFMLEIDVIYVGGVRPVVGGLVLLGIGLVLGGHLYQYGVELPSERDEWVVIGRGVGAVVLVSMVLFYLVFALFPAQFIMDEEFSNIFAHGTGLVIGGFLSGAVYRVSP